MLKFNEPVFIGKLITRYKRFFMDIDLNGEVVTAHVPNTGSLLGLLNPGAEVLITKSEGVKRKLLYTVQAISFQGSFIGINTFLPNRLIKQEILQHELFKEFHSYSQVLSEKVYGKDGRSRIDLLLINNINNDPEYYIEIKNVSLIINDIAYFPDSKTLRGQKHIDDLMGVITNKKQKAGLIFLVQAPHCLSFQAAVHIDPVYAKKLLEAYQNGLLVKAVQCIVNKEGIFLTKEVPFAPFSGLLNKNS